MKERLKNSLRVLVMGVRRRNTFFLVAISIWTIFFLYLHFKVTPRQRSELESSARTQRSELDSSARTQRSELDSSARTQRPETFQLLRRPDRTTTPSSALRKTSKSKNAMKNIYDYMTDDEVQKHKMKIRLEMQKRMQKMANHSKTEIRRESVLITPRLKQIHDTDVSNVSPTNKTDVVYVPPIRLVHFDLKGAPPKISYFRYVLPLIRRAGANGILLEYEDTFPFWGPLSGISAGNAYTKEDIQYLLDLAKTNNLDVIPLIQTFGHLEFVLKLESYRNLREVADIPQSVCPTNNETHSLVKTMIDQVMELHKDSRWLHIGCDEVYQLGRCPRCSRHEPNDLFLEYVSGIAKYVREKHHVTPIIWDDMLRHMPAEDLKRYKMGDLVEPMVWTYIEDVYLFLPVAVWEKYGEVFPFVWAASAYKGAFGETSTVPDAKRHLGNNRAWLRLMSEQGDKVKAFRGLVLTGWQRYDHFASLCELLPASLPSLILNLITVTQGQFGPEVFPKVQNLLDCVSKKRYHLDLDGDPFMWRSLGVCFFVGSPVFRLTLRHHDVTSRLDKFIHDVQVHKGWMTGYNANHNFSSSLRIDETLKDYSKKNTSLYLMREAAVNALRGVYDDFTVAEWMELNILPYEKRMEDIWKLGVRLKKFETWPRRPLPQAVQLPPTIKGASTTKS